MQPENANIQRFTFSKKERLCSEVEIENLIRKKQKFFCYPLKCFYQIKPITDESSVNQLVISVSKRYFKHAVDRNRMKRLIREAYRKNQRQLLDPVFRASGQRLQICICYVTNEILPYNLVENKIIEVLNRLTKVQQA
ncbi:MAG: ribonuclease P protein component [Bacteroidales bacterium]|nr:ribonuclease P protein component [Bacteroidales bacterium]